MQLNDRIIDQVILTSYSETLASTAGINTYEVVIEDGISLFKKIEESEEGIHNTDFFNRDTALDIQMKRSYIANPPGEE